MKNNNGSSLWTIQSGKNTAVVYSKSRGSLVPDTYLDKYGGAVVSDGLSVYKRFDPGGRHQICWAHELRNARHASQKDGAAPEAALLHGDLRLDPLLFFKPAHPAFQARFRQTACSASHSNLWFTSPHTMSLMRSYVFSGFRYLSPMIRHVLTLRIACST